MKLTGLEVISLKDASRLSASNNATGVDISKYTGDALLVLNSSATEGAGQTADVKLQHSDDNATCSDAGIAFTQVTTAAASLQTQRISMDGFKKYVRVVSTLAGTSPFVTNAVSLVAVPQ